MRAAKTYLALVVVGVMTATLAGVTAGAGGWIEWNPEQGLYWTDQTRAQAEVRIWEDDEEELRLVFQALNGLTAQEQARLMEQVRNRYGGTETVVVEPDALLEAVGPDEAQRLRDQIRTQEQLREHPREGTSDDDSDDDDATPDQDRDRDQDEDRDRDRDRDRDHSSDDDSDDGSSEDDEDDEDEDDDSDDEDDDDDDRGRSGRR